MKKTKTMAFANLVISILFILLAAWAWIQTGSFQEVSNSYVQASTFPRIMIVGMVIFSLILLAQSLVKLFTMKEDDILAAEAGSINVFKDKGVRAALIVIVLCVLYVAMFKTLGYVLCSAILSVIIMYMIGKRNWIQMLLVSLLVPLGMFLIFYKVLTVNIPMGPLTFIRDLLDTI